jgi:signal transduction histidine kinase
MAAENNIKLSVDISGDLEPVFMPPDQVKSIWTNLLSNAIKFTPPGGTVIIQLHKEESTIYGKVQDNGIGIPANAIDKIFSEFFRAQNAKDLNIPGTGLGLAIVKQIVDKVGGDIYYESEINKGTSFIFELPVVAVD